MSSPLHPFAQPTAGIEPPARFTFPFAYEPHPLCRLAAAELRQLVERHGQWHAELAAGKMLGVLVVRGAGGRLGWLAAYSGNLCGRNDWPQFVPPVYNLLDPGGEFRRGEAGITAINRAIDAALQSPALAQARQALAQEQAAAAREVESQRAAMAAAKARRAQLRASGTDTPQMVRESQFHKAELRRVKARAATRVAQAQAHVAALEAHIAALRTERRQRSEALQQRLFGLYRVSDARGRQRSILDTFRSYYPGKPGILPPAGTGECCAPKLLQYAHSHGLQPLCMAELWWGASPAGEVRHHGHYYPACNSKCRPVLQWMLQGLDVDPDPLAAPPPSVQIAVLHDDPHLQIVAKPAGLMCVPGKAAAPSLLQLLRQSMPQCMVAHRLDMGTSGIVVVAKNLDVYRQLQRQFAARQVHKHYVAVLQGEAPGVPPQGEIALPLRPDVADRPRQMVDPLHGKPALTRYRIVQRGGGLTRVLLEPVTGRTHQLRVHCSHQQGLHSPIVGDPLYGQAAGAQRMLLHAARITLAHPVTGQEIAVECPPPF